MECEYKTIHLDIPVTVMLQLKIPKGISTKFSQLNNSIWSSTHREKITENMTYFWENFSRVYSTIKFK